MRKGKVKIVDKDYFNYVSRRAEYRLKLKMLLIIFYGGRNLGKTTRVFRTEFQDSIAEFKRTQRQPSKIAILVRTEKLWSKIKRDFLDNLRQFGIDFLIEGSTIYWVTYENKVDKGGNAFIKTRRHFVIAEVMFLWSANAYKLTNLEMFRCMIMDEIIPEFDGYIPQEINKFMTLINTFSRLSEDKYIIGICNKVDDNNPYFSHFGLNSDMLPKDAEYWVNEKSRVLVENCKTNKFIKDAINNSFAGKLQQDSEYGDFALGGILNSTNYNILTKPIGEYLINYNVWIEGESFKVYDYSKSEYWIKRGNDPYVRNYYLDQFSANKNGEPYKFLSPDSLINVYRARLSKQRLWFSNSEIRDIFFNFLNKY